MSANTNPCLLFDLDGTLTNADHYHYQAFNVLLAQSGRSLNHQQFRSSIMGRANELIFQDLFPDLPKEQQIALAEFKEAQYRLLATKLEPLPGLEGLLMLAGKKAVPCIVVTNAPRANAVHSLQALGLSHYFSAVVCGAEIAHSKPHPLPYFEGLKLANADVGRSVGFEDSIAGLKAGIDAGLPMVGMTTALAGDMLIALGAILAVADYADPGMLAYISARLGVDLRAED